MVGWTDVAWRRSLTEQDLLGIWLRAEGEGMSEEGGGAMVFPLPPPLPFLRCGDISDSLSFLRRSQSLANEVQRAAVEEEDEDEEED